MILKKESERAKNLSETAGGSLIATLPALAAKIVLANCTHPSNGVNCIESQNRTDRRSLGKMVQWSVCVCVCVCVCVVLFNIHDISNYLPRSFFFSCRKQAFVRNLAMITAPQTKTGSQVKLVKNLPANTGDSRDADSIPGSGRSSGEGNGNPPLCSCLRNPMDRGAWWATGHGVAKSLT